MLSIPLSQPDIAEAEKNAVLAVLSTSKLSLGPKLPEFEKLLADAAGVKHAVAVNSGTSALHLIIKALGIGPGDEVITTPFSFIASSNCILYTGAKPVFVDIEPKAYNIDVSKIEKKITKKTKAILAVDVFSHPADWDALKKIAKQHNLFLIEDSAEALGSQYRERPCGSFGDAAIFAFYPNKQITTGEGGAVLTNNKKIADVCRSMANQGRSIKNGKWLKHVRLGYNYRLSDINCALGIAQLGRFSEMLAKRKKVAELYSQKLRGVRELETPSVAGHSSLSWFVYVVKLSEKFAGKKRDAIIQKMAKRGIQCSDYFQPIHLQPFYQREFGYKKGDYPSAEDIGRRTLALPFFNTISQENINSVVSNLTEIIDEFV